MKDFFGTCGGLLWIRLNTGRHCDTHTFIEHVLPHMTKPFTLVTADGDNSVPSDILLAQTLLDHPLLVRWLTQNYDGTTSHPKLMAFPIGFDLHTSRPGKKGLCIQGLPPLQAARRAARRGRGRKMEILFDGMRMNAHRRRADVGLGCVDHRHESHMPVDAVWDMYGSYAFGASPHGNGLDSHRTWEMLYLGMIPVVKSSSLDVLYRELPVVILEDWEDVCQQNLTKLLREMRKKLPVEDSVFTLEWWLQRTMSR